MVGLARDLPLFTDGLFPFEAMETFRFTLISLRIPSLIEFPYPSKSINRLYSDIVIVIEWYRYQRRAGAKSAIGTRRMADTGTSSKAFRIGGFPVNTLTGALTFVALVGLWAGLTEFRLISAARFPSPADVWSAAVQINTTGYAGGTLFVQIWHSLRLILFGFLTASCSGVLLGLLMGMSARAEKLLNPTFLLLRPIPPLAWIPLAILWFGLGDAAKIFVIWYAAFVPCVINTVTGVRNVDPVIVSAAEVYGASRWLLATDVIVPGALPLIFAGLRLSLQACWTTLVAAELVGAFYGIGRVLMTASQDVYPGMIFFAMACVAMLGALTTAVLTCIERWALPWRAA